MFAFACDTCHVLPSFTHHVFVALAESKLKNKKTTTTKQTTLTLTTIFQGFTCMYFSAILFLLNGNELILLKCNMITWSMIIWIAQLYIVNKSLNCLAFRESLLSWVTKAWRWSARGLHPAPFSPTSGKRNQSSNFLTMSKPLSCTWCPSKRSLTDTQGRGKGQPGTVASCTTGDRGEARCFCHAQFSCLSARDLNVPQGRINICIRLFELLQHIWEVMCTLELPIQDSLCLALSCAAGFVQMTRTYHHVLKTWKHQQGVPSGERLDSRYREGTKGGIFSGRDMVQGRDTGS